MAKLKKVEELVKRVLERKQFTKNDDFYLVVNVYCEINSDVRYKDFGYVMENHKSLKLPSFESITRARRKLQAKYPDLRGSEDMTERRYREWQDFRTYALDDDDVPF